MGTTCSGNNQLAKIEAFEKSPDPNVNGDLQMDPHITSPVISSRPIMTPEDIVNFHVSAEKCENIAAESIEQFMMQGITSGDAQETLKMILSNVNARSAFFEYLKTELAEENLLFFEDISKMRENLSTKDKDSNTDMQAQDVITSYLTPTGKSRDELRVSETTRKRLQIMTSTESAVTKQEFDQRLQRAQKEVMSVMVMGAFPRFLKSAIYKRWRNQEMLYVYDTDNRCRFREANAAAQQAFNIMENEELDNLSNCSSWLKHMVASVEALPICVSLSTANRKRPNFPLIYVNTYFEKVTGYPRSEIIGRNCRFLQGANTSKDSVATLSNALASAQPVKVEIINYRKDGTQFTNLLAMKPIFDEKGVYRYVVGLQFDVNNEVSSLSKLKFANKMLRMIPDVIFAINAEEDERDMLVRFTPSHSNGDLKA